MIHRWARSSYVNADKILFPLQIRSIIWESECIWVYKEFSIKKYPFFPAFSLKNHPKIKKMGTMTDLFSEIPKKMKFMDILWVFSTYFPSICPIRDFQRKKKRYIYKSKR